MRLHCHLLDHPDLLELKRWNTPTIYNAWEQITRRNPAEGAFNLEETRDFMPQMGPMVGYAVNILSVAFKYSLPGSPVRITARTNTGMFRVSVSDSGRGMTPEQHARIGVSRQLEKNRFEQKGMGMGLMLATTFARMSGGYLELHTGAGGKGLIVLMSLPLAAELVPNL